MIVDLVTSWDERCGLAQYALNLTTWAKGVEFKIHGRPFSPYDDFTGDILHLNHEHTLMAAWTIDAIKQLKRQGKKTVITWHNSYETGCRDEFNSLWDRVVVHEKTPDGFVHVPMGVPVWHPTQKVVPQRKIGIAGFPIGHKGFEQIAQVARDLGVGCLAICPMSQWADAVSVARTVGLLCPQAEVVIDWLPQEKVITRLAECEVVGYLHSGHHAGISASVRLGLAARRPIVITMDRQFHDLYEDYGDEIYLVNTPRPTYEHIRSVFELAFQYGEMKVPKRIIEDMSWERCGKLYKNIYDELMA